MKHAIYLCEGNSDLPLGDHVVALFRAQSVDIRLVSPDFSLLAQKVPKDLSSRLSASIRLMGAKPDLVICHRDTDGTSVAERKAEMLIALKKAEIEAALVSVIPVRMTEAWLLLDENAIRTVAGNPKGRSDLELPKLHQVERLADPKTVLRNALLVASEATGRRRERVDKRFDSNRRQLLERIDMAGPIQNLSSWKALMGEVDEAVRQLGADS